MSTQTPSEETADIKNDFLFELQDVTLRRGETTVFDGLDLAVLKGTQTAILGPNGAGKSSLLQLVTRDLYPVFKPETRVSVLGSERSRIWDLKKQLGLVSAELQLLHRRGPSEEPQAPLTGLQIAVSGFEATIGVPGHVEPSEVHLATALEILTALGAQRLAEREFDSMSTGEQRRVLLARALVHDPETLILDEPSAGLDLRARFELMDELRRLAKRGRTLVLVTHLVNEILPEITEVILLKAGRVAAQGPKEDVLKADILSRLYEVDLEVVCRGGWYDVFPG